MAEVGTALDDIDAEVGHLTSLVEDLLLLARSDSGALDLTLQPVELGDVAADAASAMMVAGRAAGACVVEVDPEPVMVVGDPLRLRQVVTILVDNAVRHSPDGGQVGVRVRRERTAAVLVGRGPGARHPTGGPAARVRPVLACARGRRAAAPASASPSRPPS